MKNSQLGVCLAVLVFFLNVEQSLATTLFSESFDGYSTFNNGGGIYNAGLPEASEGADEFWYGGRFESFDGGTVSQDVAVRVKGGNGNSTPVGRVEDEAGILFKVSTLGETDVRMDFDWRTASVSTVDRFVVGYYVGTEDLGFDTGSNRVREFYPDDFSHSQAVQWWDDNWVEITRGESSSWQHVEDVVLPANQSEVWVAMWLDNGEHDYGYIDNVHVYSDGTGGGLEPPAELSGTSLFVGTTFNSIGHEADGQTVSVPGGFSQTMPGTTVFNIADDENFTFNAYDNDSDGEWSAGDTIGIMDQTLTISRSGLGDIGTINFTDIQDNGTDLITLVSCPDCDGTPPSPPLAPSGSLDFEVKFTQDLLKSQIPSLETDYLTDYRLTGTLYVQPYDFTGDWNSFTSTNGIDVTSLFAWSSTEGPGGIVDGQLWDYTDLNNPILVEDNVPFGFDLGFNGSLLGPLEQEAVPEPSTYAMAIAGLLSLVLVAWRRRRL